MHKKIRKIDWLIITILTFVGAFLRTYRISNPLADWHSWRQSDTASVAREYLKNGIDLFHPRYQDLSRIPSGKPNPQGYRFVEFPFISAVHTLLAKTFPQFSLVVWGRILTIFITSLTIILIYFIGFKLKDRKLAFFSSLFFTLFPYNLFYGRAILPEPFMVFFMLSCFYSFFIWLENQKLVFYLLSFLSLSLAFLLKPTALVVTIPIFLLSLSRFKKLSLKNKLLLFFLPIFSLLPFLWWRNWMQQFPEGIPANRWLFNSNKIRFKGSFFRWIFGERIGKLILGYWGVLPVGLGLLSLNLKKDHGRAVLGFILGALVYLFVIATGNVQHDYYQIQIIPALAFLFGMGFSWSTDQFKKLQKLQALGILLVSIFLGLALSWYEVRGYFNINNSVMVKAGQKIDQIAPKEAKIIAPYMGDTAFLFQTKRTGWPIGGAIQEKIKKGADYYVSTSKNEEFKKLKDKYQLIYENDEFAIIKLEE